MRVPGASGLEKSAIADYTRSMHRLEVPSSLARFVRSIRIWVDPGQEIPDDYQRLPDAESELIAHPSRGSVVGTWIGTRTALLRKPTTQREPTLLVRFHAGGSYAFFREPMSALTDRVVPLADVWGEAIRDANDIDSLARATLETLKRKLQSTADHEPACVPAIRRAVRLASAAPTLPSVSELANQVGVSERQLRRGFDEVVGVSPKRFLRIARFKRVLRTLRHDVGRCALAEEPAWVALAQRAGYYDQAHMIAEFRELTGMTPSVFVRRQSWRAPKPTQI